MVRLIVVNILGLILIKNTGILNKLQWLLKIDLIFYILLLIKKYIHNWN